VLQKLPRVLLWIAFGVIVALVLSLGAFAIAGGSVGAPIGAVQISQPEGRPSPGSRGDHSPDQTPTGEPTTTWTSTPSDDPSTSSSSSRSPHETETGDDHDADDD
jgi:hypothetical protein